MSTNKPSAVTNLQKKTDHHLMVILIFLVLGFVLWLVFYTLSKQQLSEITLTKQEIESTHFSDQKLASISTFVDANSQTINKMFGFFPSEETIIDTFEIIESKVQKYDPEATVNIPKTPTKINNQLHIPITIKLNTTTQSLTKLLRELEKLPLILEITSINIAHTNTNSLQISLGVNLYVDEPFIQPKNNPSN